jgi:ribosomal protein L11 methyltransferase
MEYIQVVVATAEQEQREILIALLENSGYEGFEEHDDKLVSYIAASEYNEEDLQETLLPFGLEFSTSSIAPQNWNAQWESNFEPVIIDGFCTIRAFFHHLEINTPYEIVITPKMSFGTGHHATTKLVMQQMADMDLKGKSVLDFGTGTGILAILAEMLGAGHILAIDNDEWSYDNTKENVETNNCSRISIERGSLEIASGPYDIILANINRHILLEYMADMYAKLTAGGTLLMSGLLVADTDIIKEAAQQVGFQHKRSGEHNGWISLLFNK